MSSCLLAGQKVGPQGAAKAAASELDDTQWLRYGRQLLLPELGEAGQLKLRQARVLMVGLGGLGSPAALYMAAAGVGQLWLSDKDRVEVGNLQRQILYTCAGLGQPKTAQAVKHLKQLNPLIRVAPVAAIDGDNAHTLLTPDGIPVDLVLDCCDNMATRQVVNRACVELGVPLLSAAAVGWQGSLLLLDYRPANRNTNLGSNRTAKRGLAQHGCYHCLYPTNLEPEQNCRTAGVAGPVVGMMGTFQALEAMKFLSGIESPALGVLQHFDGLTARWRRVALQADPACPVCHSFNPGEES